jgi:hypothetical protein
VSGIATSNAFRVSPRHLSQSQGLSKEFENNERFFTLLPANEVNSIIRSKDKVREFEFVEDGRTFYCSVEVPHREGMAAWWWFRLDSGGTTRYAPFEASPSDTTQSVKRRILAYYADLLAIQARPAYQRPAWVKRPAVPAASTPAGVASPDDQLKAKAS